MAETVAANRAVAFTPATTYTEVNFSSNGARRVMVSAVDAGQAIYISFEGSDGGARNTAKEFPIPDGNALDLGDVGTFYVAAPAASGTVAVSCLPPIQVQN